MARRNANANHCTVKVSDWNHQRRLRRRSTSQAYGDRGAWPTPNRYNISSSDQTASPPDLEKLKAATKNGSRPHYDRIMDKVAVLTPEGITVRLA